MSQINKPFLFSIIRFNILIRQFTIFELLFQETHLIKKGQLSY